MQQAQREKCREFRRGWDAKMEMQAIWHAACLQEVCVYLYIQEVCIHTGRNFHNQKRAVGSLAVWMQGDRNHSLTASVHEEWKKVKDT